MARSGEANSGERSFPKMDAVGASGRYRGGGDSTGFFTANAAVDPDGPVSRGELTDQLRFEIAADALGIVFADAQTDGRARRICPSIRDAIRRDVRLLRIRRMFPPASDALVPLGWRRSLPYGWGNENNARARKPGSGRAASSANRDRRRSAVPVPPVRCRSQCC